MKNFPFYLLLFVGAYLLVKKLGMSNERNQDREDHLESERALGQMNALSNEANLLARQEFPEQSGDFDLVNPRIYDQPNPMNGSIEDFLSA